MSCEQYRDLAAEVALGVADSHDQALLVEHTRTCVGCRRELKSFEELADRLGSLAPMAEPPAGFEAGVLESFGLADPRRASARRRPFGARILVAGAAAAVVLAAIGGFALGRSDPSGPSHPTPASPLLTSQLVGGGKWLGQAIYSGGSDPWVAMSVDLTGATGEWVHCQIQLVGGKSVPVGTFVLGQGGYGYWAAQVPAADLPVAGAQILDSAGRVIASAAWR